MSLGLGEIEALHIAAENPGSMLLTDDTAARLAAQNLGMPVHGTIGILLRSIHRKQRSVAQVLDLLRALPTTSTLHIRPVFLEQIIQRVKSL